ncbi:MAG: sodium:calcium antiporter [archaeon]|nr:sodium:calcium antiporter [archaeon]
MISAIVAIIGLIGGLVVISISSDVAIKHSSLLAKALGVSPLIIGLTIVSVGTDLSEIFNSLISCSLGHGDIDVGDSIGSDLTQLTLVFGLLPIICGGFAVKRREIVVMGSCEILSLIVVYTIVEKGYITRINAIFMVGSLFFYIIIFYSISKDSYEEASHEIEITEIDKSKIYHVLIASIAFVFVTISSYVIVQSVIVIASYFHVHEYILSFFLVSIGTSLPELFVDVNALRRKENQIALGDIIGSCVVDSTLSIGIGQVFFPQAVTAQLAIPTISYTILASFIVFTVIAIRKKVDKKTGILFIALYLCSYGMLFFLL